MEDTGQVRRTAIAARSLAQMLSGTWLSPSLARSTTVRVLHCLRPNAALCSNNNTAGKYILDRQEMEVPREFVGTIIGHAGETIKRLQADSGCVHFAAHANPLLIDHVAVLAFNFNQTRMTRLPCEKCSSWAGTKSAS
jgi:hypothetical protein